MTYAHDDFEANGDTAAMAWYNAEMGKSAVLRLARDIRNVNVHETPLAMASATAQSSFGAGAFITVSSPAGAPVEARLVPAGTTVTNVRIDLTTAVPTWTGPTDVRALSQMIFDAVDAFVAEGTRLGHLRFP